MNKFKQISGFSGVAVLAVIVIVAAVGAIGWYVVMNNDRNQDQLATANQPSVQATEAPKNNASGVSREDIEKSPAETTIFSKLPVELQAVAIKEVAALQPMCVKTGKLVNIQGQPIDPEVKYAPVGAAIIGIGCDGSIAGLFAKPKGEWKFVEKTQFSFTCDALVENPVPKKLLELTPIGGECVDASGQPSSYDEASKKRYF